MSETAEVRCSACDGIVTLQERYRKLTEAEECRYPHITRMVADASCNDCGADVLAVNWRQP